MAQGFTEVLDEDYLHYRIRSVAYLGEHLLAAGVQIVEPPGGHAIYIDAAAFCPHIPPAQFPGQALVCALYRHAGIRAVEIGSVMFGRVDPDTGEASHPPMELVRLAIPRRVYTQSHIDYVIEAAGEIFQKRAADPRPAHRRGAAGAAAFHGEVRGGLGADVGDGTANPQAAERSLPWPFHLEEVRGPAVVIPPQARDGSQLPGVDPSRGVQHSIIHVKDQHLADDQVGGDWPVP